MRAILQAASFCTCLVAVAHAQLTPEIGYAYPSGGQVGTTREVILGGYDWTPDMQLFVHDPRIKLELLGPPSPVLVPEPPYWFGAKARGPAWPLPREFKARLTIPADVPPGLVRWQAANANGASPPGWLHVGNVPEIAEEAARKSPQALPALPVTVAGQVRKIEEIDQYTFSVPKAGPVTVELVTRRLGSPLHGMLKVHDAAGKLVLDAADTEGRDLTVTFAAQANAQYTLSLHDLDFAGDRSYVYRLALTPGPQVLTAYPAAGKRGETRKVEFVGIGVTTGSDRVESVVRDVTFAAAGDAATMHYRAETPWSTAPPYEFVLSDLPEHVEAPGSSAGPFPALPGAITGAIETRFGADVYQATFRKGEAWRIAAAARAPANPLDLELSVLGPDGKELATQDDAPGTSDPVLLFTVPADGVYRVVVSDRSGRSGSRAACYRLSIEPPRPTFSLVVPELMNLPLGAPAKLTIKVTREGGFAGPIAIALSGLPAGVTGPAAPAAWTIPPDKTDLVIDLTCSASAPANASLCTVTATGQGGGPPAAKAAPNVPAAPATMVRRVAPVLLATVMKSRVKLTPEGLDDVRKIHRGSTFLAPVLIERLEGFTGEVVLEMTAKQQRHRQGLASDEFKVPPGATRIEYPIFVPEWMETTKTSRMMLNGVVNVADPSGKVRTLMHRMELRIGILPEGALMKLAHAVVEPAVQAGGELRIPLSISRAAGFRDEVKIELVADESRPAALFSAAPLALKGDQSNGEVVVEISNDPRALGEQTLRLRATALREKGQRVVSETAVLIDVRPLNK